MLKELNLNEDASWKKRFRAPSIAWGQVAFQDGSHGVVCSNKDGIYQLYAWDTQSGILDQRTDAEAGVMFGMISSDGRYIYYLEDEGGNEIGHWVRVPFEGGELEDVTPEMPPYASFGFTESRDGSMKGFTAAEKDGFKIYAFAEGEAPRLIYQSAGMVFGPRYSYSGEIAIVESTEKSGTVDTHLVAVDAYSGEVIAELWDGAGTSVSAAAFAPAAGDLRVLCHTSASGFERPFFWNPKTGERTELAVDDIPGVVTPWDWSPDTRYILLNQVFQAQNQLYLYEVETGATTRLAHPPGVMGGFFGGQFLDSGEILLTWQDPSHPSRLVALDGRTGEQTRVVLTAGKVPGGADWKSVTFKSENGADIQGWLAVPEGDGPFPTILHTHGGPTSVMMPMFAPETQAWVDHGFALLTINYHGSTTFGKAFEKSIWGNLGDLEIEDMAGAYHWLVENGIAKPDAVLLTGGSYGGYLTLQAMGRRPDLWAGGMGVVAIADWFLMYEDQAETLRGYQRALFGGTPEEKEAQYRMSSPVTYAEQITAPLLIIQGRNDTRCPSRQMEVFEARLKELGKEIYIHWFDAGHGSRAQEENIKQTELKLRFAYRILG